MNKNPMMTVKEKFESKEKLVDKLLGLVDKKDGVSKDEMKTKLLKASNSKLLRMHEKLAK